MLLGLIDVFEGVIGLTRSVWKRHRARVSRGSCNTSGRVCGPRGVQAPKECLCQSAGKTKRHENLDVWNKLEAKSQRNTHYKMIYGHPVLSNTTHINYLLLFDFSRYGTRTFQGIANDGWNAIARYYLNNFADGTKQDTIDLLQGHYIVSANQDLNSSTKAGVLETNASFRSTLALVLCGIIFAYLFLQQAQNNSSDLFLSLIWAGSSLGIAAFLRVNGRVFTNRPRSYRSGLGFTNQGTKEDLLE
ncbi:hypothetical protein ZIOFF_032586 [Zingiber officinale]|uniref:Uncharacterized protein n=1 Tax=Zingiber officinale TaxID=94328 RepID=A0A8J5L1D2_ZINOF|nr:hypothetical protein ZIOFF_032586 [Zingiber officinale]